MSDDQIAKRRRALRQCPTHGQDLVLMDDQPGAPVRARFACPDPFCEYVVRRDRFALFVAV